ncbi:MAG: hypothetical protein H8E96_00625 [Verrucomicrobiaceae bacterium]|nr:hypothetical protein [Verrucomicrobiaceae bacterium]
MNTKFMNFIAPLLSFSLCLPLLGQAVFTTPEGYTKIPIAAGTAGGPTLTAISATLLNGLEHSSGATVVANFATNEQDVTVTGATWTANQWTGVPYLAYLTNTSGSEEAFLIASHTADTLTLSTTFDFLSATRFPASTTVTIRKANTVNSILGAPSTPFTTNDRVFIWEDGTWVTLATFGGNWAYFSGPNLGDSATDAVIFPEEGIFVQRAELTAAELTLFGEVPSAPQASTVAGASSYFVSTRFPVGDTPTVNPTGMRLQDLSIHDIPGWSTSDRAYFWDGAQWITLAAFGSNWAYFSGPNVGNSANDLVIPANSALFLTRASVGTESASPLNVPLPYTVE